MYQRHHLSHVDALAIAAAIWAQLEKQSKGAAMAVVDAQGELRYNAWGGGVPVVYEGPVVGAVGVSGLAEEEDMLLARMGATLFSKTRAGGEGARCSFG